MNISAPSLLLAHYVEHSCWLLKAANHRVRGGGGGDTAKIHYRVIVANDTLERRGAARKTVARSGSFSLQAHLRHRTFPNWLKSKPIRYDFQIEFRRENFSALIAFRRWLPSTPVALWLLALGRKFLMEALNRSLGRVEGTNRGSSRLERLKSFYGAIYSGTICSTSIKCAMPKRIHYGATVKN